MRLLLFLCFYGMIAAQVFAQDNDWVRALAPRAWIFPRDHGSHPTYQSEWWYFTGNVADSTGRPFGYQLTIFRQGITRHPTSGSAWATPSFYFANFAISDLKTGHFLCAERVDRGALGLAGSSEGAMQVWLRDWKIETVHPPSETYTLIANDGANALNLTVHPLKPLILEGPGGLSQKAEDPGNASNYYSYTRLATEGTLTVGGTPYIVTGLTWFDHEFSTSSLGRNQVGWDWFSLQLDSGEEVMLYILRNDDGTIAATSSGTWIFRDGHKLDLHRGDIAVEALTHWHSPKSGANYPARWKIHIAPVGADLTVEPKRTDQELSLHDLYDLAYWEGASGTEGTVQGKPVKGSGYVELTGYAKSLQAEENP